MATTAFAPKAEDNPWRVDTFMNTDEWKEVSRWYPFVFDNDDPALPHIKCACLLENADAKDGGKKTSEISAHLGYN